MKREILGKVLKILAAVFWVLAAAAIMLAVATLLDDTTKLFGDFSGVKALLYAIAMLIFTGIGAGLWSTGWHMTNPSDENAQQPQFEEDEQWK